MYVIQVFWSGPGVLTVSERGAGGGGGGGIKKHFPKEVKKENKNTKSKYFYR